MEGLQPTIDIGGNNNGMGNWGGALIGGAIGGAVGSAWGRGGNWNNGNREMVHTLAAMLRASL